MKIDYKYNRITPQDPDNIVVKKINNLCFQGVKEIFTNLNGNTVHVYKSNDGTIVEVYEFISADNAKKNIECQLKIMGCYEIPEDHRLREEGNFLLVEKQLRLSPPNGGFGYLYLDEYKCRIFTAYPAAEDDPGGVDETIVGLSGAELRDICAWSYAKHGDVLTLILKRNGQYIVKVDYNNAVLENSADIIAGLLPAQRIIPSAKDLKYQESTNHRTQVAPGVWVCDY